MYTEIKHTFAIWPGNSTARNVPKRVHMATKKEVTIIARTWKQSKRPSTGEWMNRLPSIHTGLIWQRQGTAHRHRVEWKSRTPQNTDCMILPQGVRSLRNWPREMMGLTGLGHHPLWGGVGAASRQDVSPPATPLTASSLRTPGLGSLTLPGARDVTQVASRPWIPSVDLVLSFLVSKTEREGWAETRRSPRTPHGHTGPLRQHAAWDRDVGPQDLPKQWPQPHLKGQCTTSAVCLTHSLSDCIPWPNMMPVRCWSPFLPPVRPPPNWGQNLLWTQVGLRTHTPRKGQGLLSSLQSRMSSHFPLILGHSWACDYD